MRRLLFTLCVASLALAACSGGSSGSKSSGAVAPTAMFLANTLKHAGLCDNPTQDTQDSSSIDCSAGPNAAGAVVSAYPNHSMFVRAVKKTTKDYCTISGGAGAFDYVGGNTWLVVASKDDAKVAELLHGHSVIGDPCPG